MVSPLQEMEKLCCEIIIQKDIATIITAQGRCFETTPSTLANIGIYQSIKLPCLTDPTIQELLKYARGGKPPTYPYLFQLFAAGLCEDLKVDGISYSTIKVGGPTFCIPTALLVDNFHYFEALFCRWKRENTKIFIDRCGDSFCSILGYLENNTMERFTEFYKDELEFYGYKHYTLQNQPPTPEMFREAVSTANEQDTKYDVDVVWNSICKRLHCKLADIRKEGLNSDNKGMTNVWVSTSCNGHFPSDQKQVIESRLTDLGFKVLSWSQSCINICFAEKKPN